MLIIHSSSLPTIDWWALSTAVFLLINSSAAQKCHVCLYFLLSSQQLHVLILCASIWKRKKIQPEEKSSSLTKYTIIVPRTYFNIINMCVLYSIQTVQLFSLPILSIFPSPLAFFGWHYLQTLVKSTCKIKKNCRTTRRIEETR